VTKPLVDAVKEATTLQPGAPPLAPYGQFEPYNEVPIYIMRSLSMRKTHPLRLSLMQLLLLRKNSLLHRR
jgi:hypothetical protein